MSISSVWRKVKKVFWYSLLVALVYGGVQGAVDRVKSREIQGCSAWAAVCSGSHAWDTIDTAQIDSASKVKVETSLRHSVYMVAIVVTFPYKVSAWCGGFLGYLAAAISQAAYAFLSQQAETQERPAHSSTNS